MVSPVRPVAEAEEVTIANGTSTTSDINLRGRVLTGIQMPSAWTAATITFQGSTDGVTFSDLHNSAGEISLPGTAGVYMAAAHTDLLGINFLRIRSGTSASSVNQGAERTLTLALGVAPLQ